MNQRCSTNTRRMHKLLRPLLFVVVGVLSGASAASASASDATASTGSTANGEQARNPPRIEAGYVRGLPTGQRVTSAYFLLRNPGTRALQLIGARSPRAARVEIHEHSMQGGNMRMRKRESVSIPAGGSVRFAPGGLHLMLFELDRALEDGERIALSLQFDGGTTLNVELPVCSVMKPSCP